MSLSGLWKGTGCVFSSSGSFQPSAQVASGVCSAPEPPAVCLVRVFYERQMFLQVLAAPSWSVIRACVET